MDEDWTIPDQPSAQEPQHRKSQTWSEQQKLLSGEPSSWSDRDLNELVQKGIFRVESSVSEHVALPPYWLSNPLTGVKEELEGDLGKWKASMNGYLVAFKNVRILKDKASLCSTRNVGFIYQDQPWFHLDVGATFYLYTPCTGQVLTGAVKKVGEKAAVCVVFNSFSATVFPTSNEELRSWNLGDELVIKIKSVQNRRRGPLIQANVISSESTTDPVNGFDSSFTLNESPVKKKKKKSKEPEPIHVKEEEPVKKKKKKHKGPDPELELMDIIEETPHREKKKKEKKRRIKEEFMEIN